MSMNNQNDFSTNKHILSHLILRAVQPEDLAALARIYLVSRQYHFHWLKQPRLDDFYTAIIGENIEVAEINHEIVGFSSLNINENFLHLLFIKEEWHGRGIGKMLLTSARQRVEQPLELKVVVANQRAQKFYEREGMVPVRHSTLAVPPNITYRDPMK